MRSLKGWDKLLISYVYLPILRFHVSLLKKCPSGSDSLSHTLPSVGTDGQVLAEPVEVLERRMSKLGGRAVTEVLVTWSNLPEGSATWEDYWSLKRRFPTFDSLGQE